MRFVAEFHTVFGLTLPNAYIALRQPVGGRDQIWAEADIYVSEEVFGAAPPIEQRTIEFAPQLGEGAPPIMEQALALFMAKPEFSGAVVVDG